MISGMIAGINDEASSIKFVLSLSNVRIRKQSDSALVMLIPIPIPALWTFLGNKENNLRAEPIVNLSSGKGKKIKSGDIDLDDVMLIFGIAV